MRAGPIRTSAWNNIAGVLQRRGRYADAERFYRPALAAGGGFRAGAALGGDLDAA